MSARVINIALGVWLFISAFLWPHTDSQQTNTWMMGVLCVLFAAVAMRWDQARYLNTALSVWLFVSAFILPTFSVGTVWNNALVAVAVFFVSLAPTRPSRIHHREPLRAGRDRDPFGGRHPHTV